MKNLWKNNRNTNIVLHKSKKHYIIDKIFDKYFGKHDNIIPYYWLPKWNGNVSEPSARVLDSYNEESCKSIHQSSS